MKTIVILLVIFVGLFSFIYFYEIQGEKARQEAKEREEKLIQLDRDKINEIEIVRKDKDPIVLKKSGDNWSMRQPIETPADSSTIDILLSAASSARIDRKLEQAATEAAKYGLDDPRIRVVFKADQDQVRLLLGADDFTGSKVYVQVEGSSDVYLTSDYLYTCADKELKEWRNRKALTFDRNQAQNIEIDRGSDQIKLEKKGDKWLLVHPISETADEGTINSLLSTLEYAEAQEFVAEQPENLKQYGLQTPAVTLRIREEGKDSWLTLQLGKKQGDEYLARNLERTPVFTLKSEVYDKLTQKLWEFRDKSVVDVEQDQVAQLTFKREDTEITLKHQDDGKWLVEKPDSLKGKEAYTWKFWYPLTDIKYESIEAAGKVNTGSATPDVHVTITLKDGSRRTYEFFQQGDKYLAKKVDAQRVGSITKESFEALQFKPEELAGS
ncbi:MAG TPA: DUF4340 domain-containing protein [Acidobacteriota bacterium]|nr:DUF4340 domain-containing protein [Acidobacteriota bacterium]